MESAELVKQGKRDDPVLTRTLEAFLLYMENGPSASSNGTDNSSNPASNTVNKPAPTMSAMLGEMMDPSGPTTTEQKAETSRKNANRVKAELQEASNAENNKKSGSSFFSFPVIPGINDDTSIKQHEDSKSISPKEEKTAGVKVLAGRAEFQRATNPKSALLASGWIEQQRRSRLRSTWKEVLASLVEGRKKGEETTLWIQRQIVNAQNQKELEALHQIPVKWIEEVTHFDYSADNRFALKVFNLQDEFVFRCPKDSEAAKSWVEILTATKEGKRLKKVKSSKHVKGSSADSEAATTSSNEKKGAKRDHSPKGKNKDRAEDKKNNPSHYPFDEEEKKSADHPPPHRSIKELRAIAHGAGVQTAGMERKELETVVDRIMASQADSPSENFKRKQQEELERLRVEKERMDHERRVNEEQQRRAAAAAEEKAAEQQRKADASAAEEQRMKQAEEAARLKEEAERVRHEKEEEAAAAEAARRAADEEVHRQRIAERVRQQQESERKRREEEERIRLENERREREEAEHRRRMAEMQEKERQEQMRKQQEEYGRQQRLWQEQQEEAARQQRLKEEQEARMREEELRRRRQAEQWAHANGSAPQQPQWHAHAPPPHQQHAQQQHPHRPPPQQQQRPQPQHPPHGPPPHGYAQQQHAYQQQQQQHFHHPGQQQQHTPPSHAQHHQQQYAQQQHPGSFYGAHQQQQHPQQPRTPHAQQPHSQQAPPPPRQEAPQSPISQKYAKMANAESDGAAANQQIKHGLLVHWALQPPMLQALKPVEALLTTVHTVFPPSFGVAGHDYFKKWKVVQFSDISTGAPQNRIDDDKLNKTVRKLRFFLHPDKLPSDLTADQSFLIKLLWDILNDAFEEHKKKEEDLGWIRS